MAGLKTFQLTHTTQSFQHCQPRYQVLYRGRMLVDTTNQISQLYNAHAGTAQTRFKNDVAMYIMMYFLSPNTMNYNFVI